MTEKSTNVVDVQGLTTTKFEEIKDAWKELFERAYEESVEDIENELDDGMLFEPSTVRQYVDEAEAAQYLYNMIDECKDMEDFMTESNIKLVLADMRITDMEALMEYAIDDVGIDEEIVNEMCKVFD